MSTNRFPFALALIPLTLVPRPQGEHGSEFDARVEAIAGEAMEDGGIAGLSISVALGSELLFENGWGEAPDGTRASPESLYPVGSLLEQLTVISALQLVQEGELQLDDPVTEHFPALEREGEAITIAQLLAHTSGLPGHGDLVTADRELPFDELLAAIAELPPDSAPGECFSYSDTDHALLARLVESVSGSSLHEHVTTHILEPLRMAATTFVAEAPARSAYAVSSQEVLGELLESHQAADEAQQLHSTASDLLRLQRGLVEREVLDERSYALFSEAWELADGSTTGAGFGTSRTSLGDSQGYSYGGEMAGARLHIAYYAPLDLTIVVLARADGNAPVRIERRVARAAFDMPEPGVHDRLLPPELRELYAGAYQIGCNRVDIQVRGEGLAFASVERNFELLYQGSHHAFLSADDTEVKVTFDVENGHAVRFVLEESGVRSIGVRFQRGTDD